MPKKVISISEENGNLDMMIKTILFLAQLDKYLPILLTFKSKLKMYFDQNSCLSETFSNDKQKEHSKFSSRILSDFARRLSLLQTF